MTMLTFILRCANFEPRVLVVPKKDFPKETYDTLLKYAVSDIMEPRLQRRHILVRREILIRKGVTRPSETPWSSIIDDLMRMVEEACGPMPSALPKWGKRATCSYGVTELAKQSHEIFFTFDNKLSVEVSD